MKNKHWVVKSLTNMPLVKPLVSSLDQELEDRDKNSHFDALLEKLLHDVEGSKLQDNDRKVVRAETLRLKKMLAEICSHASDRWREKKAQADKLAQSRRGIQFGINTIPFMELHKFNDGLSKTVQVTCMSMLFCIMQMIDEIANI